MLANFWDEALGCEKLSLLYCNRTATNYRSETFERIQNKLVKNFFDHWKEALNMIKATLQHIPYFATTTWLGRCVALAAYSLSFVTPQHAQAKGWGLGIGYHNPVSSDLGVSLMHMWNSVAFEAALGAIGVWGNDDDEEDEHTGLKLGGDVDLKLLFGSGLKAYLQGGLSYGAEASSAGAGLNIGGSEVFAGAGLFLLGSELYAQIGGDYLFKREKPQVTGTIGFFL